MIQINQLTKYYGNHKAIDNISFNINKGEILGLLGPNGAGKSTIMNILTGFISYSSGQVNIFGKDIRLNPLEVKKMIGYLPEIPPLYMFMTVKEYLYFVYRLKNVHNNFNEHIEQIVNLTGIQKVYKRLIKNLSKGYKQRVGFAQALIGNPEILILDEPTTGLDPKQIIDIRNVIRDMKKHHTIILSSHILPEINSLCDRVVIINKGTIIAEDTPKNLSRSLLGKGTLLARIKGRINKVSSLLKNITGVNKVNIQASQEAGTYDYIIETSSEIDVRSQIFYSLSKEKCPIYLLKPYDLDFEEVFVQLITKERAV